MVVPFFKFVFQYKNSIDVFGVLNLIVGSVRFLLFKINLFIEGETLSFKFFIFENRSSYIFFNLTSPT